MFWLQSIATYSVDAGADKHTPPVILVGTHKDKLTGTVCLNVLFIEICCTAITLFLISISICNKWYL